RVFGPPAGLDRGIGEYEPPRKREHQQDDVLGDRLDERLGAVHHRYPLRLGSLDVYVVESRPRSGDKTESRSRLDHLPVNPRPAPDHEPVVAADGPQKLLSRYVGPVVDLEILVQAELGDAESVADEQPNLLLHDCFLISRPVFAASAIGERSVGDSRPKLDSWYARSGRVIPLEIINEIASS